MSLGILKCDRRATVNTVVLIEIKLHHFHRVICKLGVGQGIDWRSIAHEHENAICIRIETSYCVSKSDFPYELLSSVSLQRRLSLIKKTAGSLDPID